MLSGWSGSSSTASRSSANAASLLPRRSAAMACRRIGERIWFRSISPALSSSDGPLIACLRRPDSSNASIRATTRGDTCASSASGEAGRSPVVPPDRAILRPPSPDSCLSDAVPRHVSRASLRERGAGAEDSVLARTKRG